MSLKKNKKLVENSCEEKLSKLFSISDSERKTTDRTATPRQPAVLMLCRDMLHIWGQCVLWGHCPFFDYAMVSKISALKTHSGGKKSCFWCFYVVFF